MTKAEFTTVATVENPMGPTPVRSEVAGLTLTPQRAAVLEYLQHRATSLTRFEVATHLGLHPNTARGHLEALVSRGLVERFGSAPHGRGRPSWCYRAAKGSGDPDIRVQDYTGLAVALADHVARTSSNPAAAAVEVGMNWARTLEVARAETEVAGGEDYLRAARFIQDQLATLGFAPEMVGSGANPTMRLVRCPLLDAARRNTVVVCNVHLGLVRGLLSEAGHEVQADLRPFSEPGACLLELSGQHSKC